MYNLWNVAVLYIKEQSALPFIGFGVIHDIIGDITYDIIGIWVVKGIPAWKR